MSEKKASNIDQDVNWADLQPFLAIAREGGLSPAVRLTGRSPATLGRRMLACPRTRLEPRLVHAPRQRL